MFGNGAGTHNRNEDFLASQYYDPRERDSPERINDVLDESGVEHTEKRRRISVGIKKSELALLIYYFVWLQMRTVYSLHL